MRRKRGNVIRFFGIGISIVLLAFLALASPVDAQYYFGKNKIQYSDFDWQVMTTEHFRIYFYTEGAEVARIAGKIAEDSYDELSAKFNHEVNRKIPLIIYSASAYFSQTNILPYLIPESVGGFTEFIKGRVAVPFHGSYSEFEHVIKHEMVHVFTFSKISSEISRQARLRFAYPPLWFTEGLAEYWSEGWDTDADMFIKDMVVNGNLLPISRFYVVRGSYYTYKLGQSVCKFIEEEYGPDKILKIFDNWSKGRKFEDIIQMTLGDNLEEVNRKWQYSCKKKYFPEFDKLGLPRMESRQLTKGGYSLKGVPISWDDKGYNQWLVYKANRRGYSELVMKPLNESQHDIHTLLKGEHSARFESLYFMRSGIDAHKSGLVVFSSKSKERDVIYIYDLNKNEVTRRFEFEELIAIRSPRFSPKADKVVFSGIWRDGFTDIFELDLQTGEFKTLTDDIYYDIDPAYSPDGRYIYFASDRGPYGRDGATNIYRLDIADDSLTQLTFGAFDDQSPEPCDQGIYFSSNRQGTYNIFLLSPDGRLTQQSTYVTGAFDPRLTPDGKKLVYTGFEGMTFQIYEMDLPEEPLAVAQPGEIDKPVWKPPYVDQRFYKSSIKYDAEYSFDIAQSSIAYDPVYGTIGGFQAAMSDMLGNRAYYFLLSNTAETKDELLQSFNVGLTYINREKHLNWGLGVFHLYNEYYNDYDQYYDERQAGVAGLLSYPLSKFQRVEFNTYARYYFKDRRYGLKDREAFLTTNYLRFVYDNSLWDITGPIEGRRYNITVGWTFSISDGRSYNRIGSIDLRHYFRLGQHSAFANRLFAYSSSGLEPQRIYFGGSWSFRGFDRRAFYNRNILFASNELRFPLIDDLLIGLPIGGLGFQGIRGALFFDTGSAWDDEFDQFLGSFGAGFRVNLGNLVVLRFDFSRTTDFETISDYTDFDFFFGWNF